VGTAIFCFLQLANKKAPQMALLKKMKTQVFYSSKKLFNTSERDG